MFGSDAERRAAFRRMTGGGGDVLAGRRLGTGFVRRGNGGRLLKTGASRRDQLMLARAAARVEDGEKAVKRFETVQRREEVRQGATRRALLRGAGIGTAALAVGGVGALALSPALRGALGRRLIRVRKVIPGGVVRAPAEAAGNLYLKARRGAAAKLGNAAARFVQRIERWVAGYTPGVDGPLPTKPVIPRRVRLEDIPENDVVSRWQAQQAADALPDGSLTIGESAYQHQAGLADRIDVAWKTFLKRRFKMDIDPEWTLRLGNRVSPTRRSLWETLNYKPQGYARVRGMG